MKNIKLDNKHNNMFIFAKVNPQHSSFWVSTGWVAQKHCMYCMVFWIFVLLSLQKPLWLQNILWSLSWGTLLKCKERYLSQLDTVL